MKNTDGETNVVVPKKSAGFKVLCNYHNSNLAELDVHAGRVFSELGDAVFPARMPQKEAVSAWVYIDGPRLEAYAVKLISAYQAADVFTSFGSPITHRVDWEKVRNAINTATFEEGGGLYICASFASNEVDGIHFVPVVSGGWLVGVHVVMRSFSYMVIFDKSRCEQDAIPSNATYRGSIHQLFGQGGSAFIYLAWYKKPDLRHFSQGPLQWTPHPSNSRAPYLPTIGERKVEYRTKASSVSSEKHEAFAPKPVAPVIAPPMPLNRRQRFK